LSWIEWVRWQREPGEPAPQAWPTAAPAEVELDAAALESLAGRIERRELENVHSLLVVRDGKLAFERYFAGEDTQIMAPPKHVVFDAETLHDARSVSKSVVGALFGIAHGEGAIPALDAPLARFFPKQARGRETELAGRTLRHALTMSAGLSWDELTHPYWDPRNDEHALWLASDPVDHGLSRAPVAPPGARFAYNGSLPMLLAQVVEQATGTTLDRYAAEKLWRPLGVTRAEWGRHPSGVFLSPSGLRLVPRDLARFGQMMLDEGRFAGRQVVPADFARASLEPQVSLPPGFGGATGYGYLWWIGRFPLASGNGGQRVVVDRETRTVIVTTAGLYDSPKQGDVPLQVLAGVLAAYR